MGKEVKILFLCTGNSCRSQMAEGWGKMLGEGLFESFSAGIETHGLNPYAVRAMSEKGVDISKHKSQNVSEFKDIEFDYIITVCGHAHENCPVFTGKGKVIHKGFEDPPGLAANASSEEDKMVHYRRVRDEIRDYVEYLTEEIKKGAIL